MAVAALLSDDELEQRTTRILASALEATALLVQAVNLVVSAAIETLTPTGLHIMWALALVHLVFADIARRTRGPLTRGGVWAILWIGSVILMPLLIAHLVLPYQYASGAGCVQLCTYPTAPVALFSIYPWIGSDWLHLRPAIELGILVVVVFEPLLIVRILRDGELSMTNYQSIAVSGLWNLTAYATGKAVRRLCSMAVARLIELQRDNYDEFFRYLHTQVEGAIAVIQREKGSRDDVLARLRDLYSSLVRRRLDMQLVHSQIEVAPLFVDTLRVFGNALQIYRSPRLDGLVLDRQVAVLVHQTLGDLLKNATQHGAHGLGVDFSYDSNMVTLEVDDDGPGFSAAVLDDPATSLNRLRRDARSLGGDLRQISEEGNGSRMRLTLPINQ
jgi:signal transduction histidine kinase